MAGHDNDVPTGGTERFLLGFILFFILFITLVVYVYNQNYVTLVQ